MPDLFGNSRLRKELDAWQKAVGSLSPDDRTALETAMQNAMQYAEFFIENSPGGHETEALLVSILLSQQKRIQELKQELGRDSETRA
jgi:hypothetical protein